MSKEEIFDEHIQPLMAQILDLCKQHGIAVAISFDVTDAEAEDATPLYCSLLLPDETGSFPEGLVKDQAALILASARDAARPITDLEG